MSMTMLSNDDWPPAMACSWLSMGLGRRFCWELVFPAESVELSVTKWLFMSSSVISAKPRHLSTPRGGTTCAEVGDVVCREGGLVGGWSLLYPMGEGWLCTTEVEEGSATGWSCSRGIGIVLPGALAEEGGTGWL